ncbi:MAG: hypothetical protein O3A00_20710, partial [Planctomycetota bacterium]|nr:hypothetical protein [Planctomycetota bacterium]
RDQHELLASSGMLAKSPIPVSEFRRIVPFLESIFQTLLDSELKDTEQLKNFDGRRFLTNTGGQLIRQLKLATKEFLPNVTWEQYSKDAVLVTALNVDGDSAVVEVMLRGSALPPTNLKMSRVEGYWIPAALASGWAASIAAARGEISKMPPVTKESQNVQLKSIAAVNGLLDELAKVETVDEFNVAAGKLLGGFFPGNISEAANTSPPSAAASPSTNTGTIHIVVTQLLDDKAIDELIERWERLSDKPEISEVDTFTKDGHTVFVVSPVSDLKTFAEGIDFVDSVDLDPKHNAIRITLPKPTTKP